MSGGDWLFMDDFWFKVTFVYRDSHHTAKVVHLVGDFCGWKQLDMLQMSCCAEGYSLTLPLQEGYYHYKFLVDDEWVRDVHNPHRAGAFDNSLMFVHMDPGVHGLRAQYPPHRDYHRPNSDGSHFQVLSPPIPTELASYGVLERLVFVYLPPSYHSSGECHYPVVYAHDGQNLFSTPEHRGGPFRGGWYLDAKLDHYWSQKVLPEFILVAIPNSDFVCIGNRTREYCTGTLANAQEDPFVRYLITIKAEVDSKYRTLSDAQNTITLGASMGGLLSFTLAMTHPDVFSRAVCMSPSFWYVDRNNRTAYDLVIPITSEHAEVNNTEAMSTVESVVDLNHSAASATEHTMPSPPISTALADLTTNPKASAVESMLSTLDALDSARRQFTASGACCRVYIDSGDGEGDNMFETREMQAVLLQNGWTAGTDFMYILDKCRDRVDMGITHSESVWRERVHMGLMFAFSGKS